MSLWLWEAIQELPREGYLMALSPTNLPLRCDFRFGYSDQTPREFGHALQRRSGLALRGHRCFLRPRSRCLRLLALRRSGAQVRASQVAVGDAASYNVSQDADKPRPVIAGAFIEAAHLFINVPKQM